MSGMIVPPPNCPHCGELEQIQRVCGHCGYVYEHVGHSFPQMVAVLFFVVYFTWLAVTLLQWLTPHGVTGKSKTLVQVLAEQREWFKGIRIR